METVLLYILGIVIIFVGVLVSIALHEVGHLVPAKKFRVFVGQYMVGFGPTLWSRRRGETEYGIKAIPLGGYISMAGMYPPAAGAEAARNSSTGFVQTLAQDAESAKADVVTPGLEGRTFYDLAWWKRIIIMLGGPVMNLLIGIVLYAVVLVGFGVPQLSTTLGSVNECVIASTSTQTACTDADPVAPAAEAGLRPGDRFVSIDGEAITSWNQATAIIRDSAGDPLTIVIERDGEQLTVEATPALSERYVTDDDGTILEDENGERRTHEVGFLGIGSSYETVQQPITAVLPTVGDNVVRVVGIVLNLPQRLYDVAVAAFGPEERDPEGPIGMVGVGRLAGEITSLDAAPVADRASALIQLLASLNIALFVFNLIPLLPLDGGHVAGALWETLRRRVAKIFKRPDPGPFDLTKLLPLTMVVVVILGAMTVLLVYADIVKPISIL